MKYTDKNAEIYSKSGPTEPNPATLARSLKSYLPNALDDWKSTVRLPRNSTFGVSVAD